MKNLPQIAPDPQMTPTPPWLRSFTRYADATNVDWIGQSDPRYESARLLYNRFHDLRPAALVRTKEVRHVAEVIRFASEHGVPLAIRGGGHHVAGYGSCEGGIVIDFSPFRDIVLDRGTGIVEVEPGVRLGDLDRNLCPQGLVIPTGTVSDTGLAGLTLGGGIGWLVGRYGLTCDQLVGADVVLANGETVCAEDSCHEDLLWALRGGGGNFGVVTRLRYRVLSLPPCIVGSAVVPFERAAAALEGTIDFLNTACPPELTVAPTLTRLASGRPLLSIDFCLASANASALHSLRDAVGPCEWSTRCDGDYCAWQCSFDHLFQPPMRGYWKSRYVKQLQSGDIETLIDAFASAPSHHSAILIEHLHGAFADASPSTSAFPLRWARFGVLLAARWPNALDDAPAIDWVRTSFARLDPAHTSAAYSNYTAHDDDRAISTFAAGSTGRLSQVKSRYDPHNLFRRNHNFSSKLLAG